ncbi:Sodium/hydrogen exchanger family-domain-containing protein [Pelagophyceae sp. CCMP2097]|nr:Sodium/hydrogen exchanger family-domain-containing protein [Pelagophyceae sp. CCMP2097]
MGDEGGTPFFDITHQTWGYSENQKKDSTFLCAFVLLICISLGLSALCHKYHVTVLPEACVVLSVGLVAGFVCKAIYGTRLGFFSRAMLSFDNALFFLALLPPIIFNSGYQLHPNWLFGLFGPIMAFSIAGTLFSAIVIGTVLSLASAAGMVPPVTFAETLTFGALVSATDPVSVLAVFTELRVDPKMFYLIFGESVLNDAVGIVLFKTFAKYIGFEHSPLTLLIAIVDFIVIFLGSMILGFLCAIAFALLLRLLRCDPSHVTVEGAKNARKLQLVAMAVSVFAVAFIAEIVELSGIVATLFAAVGIRHWGLPNMQASPDDATPNTPAEEVDALMNTLSHLADTIVFLYLGLSVPAAAKEWQMVYSHSMVIWSIVACIASRAMQIYPLSWLNNYHARKNIKDKGASATLEERVRQSEIPMNMQHMLWFAGLRGAVAFSCSHIFPNELGNRDLFSVTTTMVIIVSMYVLGALTIPTLDYLNVSKGCEVSRDVVVERPTLRRRKSRKDAHSDAPQVTRFFRALAYMDNWLYPLCVATPPSQDNLMAQDGRTGLHSMVELATTVEFSSRHGGEHKSGTMV